MREREGRREERYKVGYLVCVRDRERKIETCRERERTRERELCTIGSLFSRVAGDWTGRIIITRHG